jgi:hypothetical protein
LGTNISAGNGALSSSEKLLYENKKRGNHVEKVIECWMI